MWKRDLGRPLSLTHSVKGRLHWACRHILCQWSGLEDMGISSTAFSGGVQEATNTESYIISFQFTCHTCLERYYKQVICKIWILYQCHVYSTKHWHTEIEFPMGLLEQPKQRILYKIFLCYPRDSTMKVLSDTGTVGACYPPPQMTVTLSWDQISLCIRDL